MTALTLLRDPHPICVRNEFSRQLYVWTSGSQGTSLAPMTPREATPTTTLSIVTKSHYTVVNRVDHKGTEEEGFEAKRF